MDVDNEVIVKRAWVLIWPTFPGIRPTPAKLIRDGGRGLFTDLEAAQAAAYRSRGAAVAEIGFTERELTALGINWAREDA